MEIELGVDGFMVHDVDLIPDVLNMVNGLIPGDNQLHTIPSIAFSLTPTDLLTLPEVSHFFQLFVILTLIVFYVLSCCG